MSNSNWKSRFKRKPSQRTMIFSKKENRWLSEEEAEEVEKLLAEKRKQVTDLLIADAEEKIKAREEEKEESSSAGSGTP